MFRNEVLILLALIFAASLPARADVVVNWGGEYVTSTQNLQGITPPTASALETMIDLDGDMNNDDARTGRNFATTYPTAAMQPASGYSGTSGQFFGGASLGQPDTSTPGIWDNFEVQNQGLNDQLHFRMQNTTSVNGHIAVYWDYRDFLGASAGVPVQFTTSSSFTMTVHNNNSHLEDAIGRWLVREGSQFYLSQQFFSLPISTGSANPSLTFASDGSDGSWVQYNPTGLAIDSNDMGFTPQNFSNVTAVGFYVEHDPFVHNSLEFAVSQFTVNAQPVPEPSTLLLCMLGLAGLAVRKARIVRQR